MKKFVAYIFALVLLALAPVAAHAQSRPAPATQQNLAAATPAGPAYRVNPGDDLEIMVWGDERLQRTVRVLPDGTFSFPLVGHVMAAGLLPTDLERIITVGLRPQYRDVVPQVTVLVKNPSGYQFSVIGKVRSPGTFTPGRYVNALEAIGIAGGPTEFAQTGRIRIIRKSGQQVLTIPVRVAAALKGDFGNLSHSRNPATAERRYIGGAMTRTRFYGRLASTALAISLLSSATATWSQAQEPEPQEEATETSRRQPTFLDLEAGLGYSTNAFLGFDAESSIYGRISATGAHSWISETGVIGIRGFIENTTYFQGGYGSKQIFSLGASTTQQLSPTVSIYGDLGFSGDFGGQLANRFVYGPTGPVVPDPANPIPDPTVNPDLFGITGRQYRVNGDAGVSIQSGARSSISLSGGVIHAFSSGSNEAGDYTTFHGSGSYARELSERTRGGVSLTVARQNFRSGGWSNTINPALFASTQLSERFLGGGIDRRDANPPEFRGWV